MSISELKNQIGEKSRLIGLDMGKKRIGVSISDDKRKIAIPLETIYFKNITILTKKIKEIIADYNIGAVVYGDPINMDGSKGSSSQSVKDRIAILSNNIKIPFIAWDERLSTVAAFKISRQLDTNVSKRVKNIDKNAAAFILQGVLDYLQN